MPAVALSRVGARVVESGPDGQELAADTWQKLEVLPDPRSPRQPFGIKGLSRTYDHAAFRWTDERWRGGALHGSVIYELHTGTFTAEGTFDAAIGRLDHLCDLGVHAVELMPVAGFPG